YLEAQLGTAVIERGIANILRIVDATGCRVIMDHHAVRNEGYRERFRRVWDTGRAVTAAEFLGLADEPLEARRWAAWRGRRRPRVRMRGRGVPAAGTDEAPPRTAGGRFLRRRAGSS